MRSQTPRLLHSLALAALCVFPALQAGTALAAPVPSQAQGEAVDPPGRVGRISEVQGQVWLFHPEEGEWIAAERNRPLTAGDRVATDGDGRAEIRIGSTTLRVDRGSEFEVLRLDDEHLSLQLHGGSLAVRLRSREAVPEFDLRTGEGRFTAQRTGRYRFDREDDTSRVTVLSGQALFEGPGSALTVYGGQRAEFWLDNANAAQYSILEPVRDAFAGWVAERDRVDDRSVSTRYVSPEMTGVEDLDRYGAWQQNPEYGALWVPRGVSANWAPYTTGRWAWVSPWGWTWVDDAPWGFAPFHYGRWVYVGASWCWSPGSYVRRPVYAPALVAWIGGPRLQIGITVGGGPAVGWVPLAPREVYVPTYRVSPGYVRSVNVTHVTNITNITTIINNPQQAVGERDYRNRKFPHAVTVVPASTLTTRQPVAPAAAQWRNSPAVREIASQPPRANIVAASPVAAPPPAQRRPDAPAARPAPGANVSPAVREAAPGFRRDQPDVLRRAPDGRPAVTPQPAQPVQPQPQAQPQPRTAPVTPPAVAAPPSARPQPMPTPSPALRPVQPAQPGQPAQPPQVPPAQPTPRAAPVQPAAPPAPVQRPAATPVPILNPGAVMRGNGQPGRVERPEPTVRAPQAEPQRASEQRAPDRRERDERPGAVRER